MAMLDSQRYPDIHTHACIQQNSRKKKLSESGKPNMNQEFYISHYNARYAHNTFHQQCLSNQVIK